MIVDALVALGYPFGEIRKMPVSEALEWLDVATKRVSSNSGA